LGRVVETVVLVQAWITKSCFLSSQATSVAGLSRTVGWFFHVEWCACSSAVRFVPVTVAF
jgi:hypothetical protein